ncbi:hypothetical protein E2C01_088892 [Portunus trituberculatus]|uniref:Uncharacterized protein n=1 Tax=Portunus trituberculatus TaxID=210409 RepID=A0A5B7J7D0_PORTR|nr:hypothetical protein [Portunus trituberculatus]
MRRPRPPYRFALTSEATQLYTIVRLPRVSPAKPSRPHLHCIAPLMPSLLHNCFLFAITTATTSVTVISALPFQHLYYQDLEKHQQQRRQQQQQEQ